MTKLSAFETAVLTGVGAGLPVRRRKQFDSQVARINRVQRLLDWHEIEFYCMRWFRIAWPAEVLFDSRDEELLGSGVLRAERMETSIKVWAVGGHVFSIESEAPLRPFQSAPAISFTLTL